MAFLMHNISEEKILEHVEISCPTKDLPGYNIIVHESLAMVARDVITGREPVAKLLYYMK